MKKLLPSLLLFIISIVGVFILFKPSNEPTLFGIFSPARFTVICAFICFAAYFASSLRFSKLQSLNNQMVIILIIGSIFIEGVLRAFPSLITTDLLFLLPVDARQQIAENRGKLTEKMLIGDGLLFTHKPDTPVSENGTVYDKNGFRNLETPKDHVHLSLIGASIVEGTGVKTNLGESLIQMGVNTYTLAAPAWGPGQYRDSYQKFIIKPNIKNDIAITFTSIPRDLNIASTYENIKNTSGDWRDFFGRPKLIGLPIESRWMPWTISIYNKLPYHLLSVIQNRNPVIKTSQNSSEEQLVINLEYQDYSVSPNYFKPINLLGSWSRYELIMGDHLRSITKHGAKPIIAYLPSPPMLLIPFIKNNDKLKASLNKQMEFDRQKIKTLTHQNGAEFLDLSGPIRENIAKIKIIASPKNAHLTQKGTEFIMGEIMKHIGVMRP